MKPRPILGDMPWHIKQKIVDKADFISQLNLRLCSKEYRDLVSTAETRYGTVECTIRPTLIVIIAQNPWHELEVKFEWNPPDELKIVNVRGYEFGRRARTVRGGDYIDAAIARLMKIFKGPKVSVRTFFLTVLARDYPEHRTRFLSKFADGLRAVGCKLDVEELFLEIEHNQNDVLPILAHVKPGKLASFTLQSYGYLSGDDDVAISLDKVLKMEQWKQARTRSLVGFFWDNPHYKDFEIDVIKLKELTITCLNNVINSFTRNSKWRRVEIVYQSANNEQIAEVFQRFEAFESRPNTWRIDVTRTGQTNILGTFDESKIELFKTPSTAPDSLSDSPGS